MKNIEAVHGLEPCYDIADRVVAYMSHMQFSGWILMDFGDVIVNVLTEEMRERYKREKVWADCEVIKA